MINKTQTHKYKGIYAVDRESLVRFTDDNPLLAKAYEDVISGKDMENGYKDIVCINEPILELGDD